MNIKASIAGAFLLFLTNVAWSADEQFDIVRFQVEGNTLLTEQEVQRRVAPFIGRQRVYGDIQKALEALEQAYRSLGYSTVQVYVPEQELVSGVVRLAVTESVIGKLVIAGNEQFSEENIRMSLPQLKEGRAPNARLLSENIQLANDNPAKQVEVTLGVGNAEGTVDARVKVSEEPIQKIYVTADNTGSGATGHIRSGIAYQHANLLNGDETLTLAYTTSPDAPQGVSVDIYSVAFRKPFYDYGDSLDFIYGDSNVNTPITQATGFGLSGKGQVFGLRWNHNFPRQGEFSSKLVFGYDYKFFNSQSPTFPVGFIPAFTPYTTRPVSVAYMGQWVTPAFAADFNVSVAHNLPLGGRHPGGPGNVTDHYSFIAGRQADDDFTVLRWGGSYFMPLQDWQFRVALNGQWVRNGLAPGEQLGLVGSTAVRGFSERAIATDMGLTANLELYSPDLAKNLALPGSLRGILFMDSAKGWNNGGAALEETSAASWGGGVRYGWGKSVSLRADMAQITDRGPLVNVRNGSWRGHFSLSLGF